MFLFRLFVILLFNDSSCFMYDRVESAVFIRCVFNCSDRSVRFDYCVLSFDHVTVTALLLALDIAGAVVVHAIVVSVFRRRLQATNQNKSNLGGNYRKTKQHESSIVFPDNDTRFAVIIAAISWLAVSSPLKFTFICI